VKGIHFQNLRDCGDPAELAARYDAEGADELVVLDIAAAHEGRTTFLETIQRVAAQMHIPLTAGGGIRSVAEARGVLRAGADKVTVNTAAVLNPALLGDLAGEFGVQAVVLAVDVRRQEQGWQVFIRGGREDAGRDALAWAREAVERGAGEILLTSMDRDGTRQGFDCDLTAEVSSAVTVPVIASGGAGGPDDFHAVFTDGRADAALAASIFHEAACSISALKRYLSERGLPVRPAPAASASGR
jgi:cyclase